MNDTNYINIIDGRKIELVSNSHLYLDGKLVDKNVGFLGIGIPLLSRWRLYTEFDGVSNYNYSVEMTFHFIAGGICRMKVYINGVLDCKKTIGY